MPETALVGDANVAESILAALTAEEGDTGKARDEAKADKDAEAPDAEAPDTQEGDDAAERNAASDDESEDAEPEEAEEESKAEPDDLIEVNGEKITLDELKKGYLRQKDYTQKTQALAPERQAIETERRQAKEFLNQVQSFVQMIDPLKQFREIDWDRLSAEDPDAYTRMRHQYDRTVTAMRQVEAAHRAATDQAFEQYARSQREAMLAALPDWADDVKQPVILKEMGDAMVAVGFTADDVRKTVDHRILLLARDAAYGQKMRQAEKTAKEKAVKAPPKVIAPKGGKDQAKDKTLREKQALTRNWRAARSDSEQADAILRML